MHGKGLCSFSDGGNYTGEWRNGKAHGVGLYTLASGETYEGEWEDGVLHGEGTVTYANAVTKQNKVVSFSHIYQHSSKAAAKSAERCNYYAAKMKHGANNVRGAGNTKTF